MENVLNKTIFSRERVIGFVLYFAVLIALFLVRIAFSKSETDFTAIVSYMVGGALFILAFFGLSSRNYKLYAQGALLGWLLNIILPVGLKILL